MAFTPLNDLPFKSICIYVCSHEMPDFFVWEIYDWIKRHLSKNLNSKKYSHDKYTFCRLIGALYKLINWVVGNWCRDKDGGEKII